MTKEKRAALGVATAAYTWEIEQQVQTFPAEFRERLEKLVDTACQCGGFMGQVVEADAEDKRKKHDREQRQPIYWLIGICSILWFIGMVWH